MNDLNKFTKTKPNKNTQIHIVKKGRLLVS